MTDGDDAAAIATATATRRRQRRRSTGMEDDGMWALPENLQHEVFSRVGDVRSLFRFAATCRRWLRCFTDPAFLRELCPGTGSHGSGHRARLLGVVLQDRWFNRYTKAVVQARMTTMAAPAPAAAPPQSSAAAAALAPVFLPALGSPLGPAGRALTSFVTGADDDRTFDYAEPLASRRGIVLFQLAPRTRKEMNHCLLFGVCNPVTGDRHVLPPLEWDPATDGRRRVVDGYAIITADDDSRGGSGDNGRPDHHHPPAAARWTFSQLLIITRDQDGDRPRREGDDDDVHLHSYSAATRRWSAPTACLDRRFFSVLGSGASAGSRSAVVHGGAAHWLCVDDGHYPYGRAARRDGAEQLYRLSVDVGTARVSLTRLPVRVGGTPLLGVNKDGKLVVASVYPVHVTVWTPPAGAGAGDDNDDDTTPAAAEWPRASFRIDARQKPHETWCNFNQGSLLALFRGSSGVLILDVDTKVMDEVLVLDFESKCKAFLASSGANVYLTCVPYEMDLVEFFMHQLGGIRSQRLIGTTPTSGSETESP